MAEKETLKSAASVQMLPLWFTRKIKKAFFRVHAASLLLGEVRWGELFGHTMPF